MRSSIFTLHENSRHLEIDDISLLISFNSSIPRAMLVFQSEKFYQNFHGILHSENTTIKRNLENLEVLF